MFNKKLIFNYNRNEQEREELKAELAQKQADIHNETQLWADEFNKKGELSNFQQQKFRANINNYYNSSRDPLAEEKRFSALSYLQKHNENFRKQEQQQAMNLSARMPNIEEDFPKGVFPHYLPPSMQLDQIPNSISRMYNSWEGLKKLEKKDKDLGGVLDRTNVDKAGHCTVSCQGRRRGVIDEAVTNSALWAKEYLLDGGAKQVFKKGEGINQEDLRANDYGWKHARDKGTCCEICEQEFPMNLDPSYRNKKYFRSLDCNKPNYKKRP